MNAWRMAAAVAAAVLLDGLAGAGGPAPAAAAQTMTGMFTVQAGAARFRDCRTGTAFAVAPTGDYDALARAYLRDRSAAGAPLLVTVRGRLEPHPREGGRVREARLVVEQFLRDMPGQPCPPARLDADALPGTRWAPVRIAGRTLVVPSRGHEPFVEFGTDGRRLTGFTGCNRMTGRYRLSAPDRLRMRDLVTTRMTCPDLSLETALLHALEATRRYELGERTLDLFDAGGARLARLERRGAR